ncbi:MAG: glycogen synthase [Deltaproteobacteria bacterium]|nr:MAG: glycogen synthase [Deltaproteobacteria bacterium]
MKIAILTNEYPPHIYGGAGVHVEHLVRKLAALAGRQHQINVLCFGDQQEKTDNITVQGVNPDFPFAAQDPRHVKMFEALLRNLVMAGVLAGADIVHCHTWYTHLAGCLLQQMLGIPLVLTTHSLEPQRPWKAEQLGSGYQAVTWLERTAYQNADGVIAVSQAIRQDVHDIYDVPLAKIRVIYNGIDTQKYRPTSDPALLAAYNIRPDKPFILFVGRITRQKGIIHLVQAIKYLKPGLQVVLCAGGPDTADLGKEMAARVEQARADTENELIWIEKFLPPEQIVALYSQAALFVCPSVYEPFGIINLEAMACGTPVVASAVGGIKEVVDAETGVLVPFAPQSRTNPEPQDPERFARDLAAAINRLLQDPEKLQTMGLKARQRVEQHFSWESIAQQTLDFYRELTITSYPGYPDTLTIPPNPL